MPPFFADIPAYRPPLAIVAQPARNVPSLADLKIRVIEGVKTSMILAGLLANEKVTVRDTGCGAFTSTGTLGRFVTRSISVDPLMAQFQDCATAYETTILQAALKAGHANDPDLTGTEIERLVRTYLEGGELTVAENDQVKTLVDLALSTTVTPTVYRDALRIWMLGDKSLTDVNYNGSDGLRKKLLAAAPVAGDTGTTGAYRGAAIDYAAIEANPLLIFDLLDDLYENASSELQDIDEGAKAIYLTKSLYRQLKKSMRLFPNLESSKLAYTAGTQTITYEGIEVIEFKPWEQYMKADFPASSPHLALYTATENLVFLTDLESDMTTAEFWYDRLTRFNYSRVLFRMGSGFSYDVLIAFAV